MIKSLKHVYPCFLYLLCLIQGDVGLEPISADNGWEVGHVDYQKGKSLSVIKKK